MTDSPALGDAALGGFDLRVARDDDRARVVVGGEIDRSGAQRLSDVLSELRDARTPTVLDLRGVSYMDSATLHVLVDHVAEAKSGPWELSVAGSFSRQVDNLLFVSGVAAVLPLLEE